MKTKIYTLLMKSTKIRHDLYNPDWIVACHDIWKLLLKAHSISFDLVGVKWSTACFYIIQIKDRSSLFLCNPFNAFFSSIHGAAKHFISTGLQRSLLLFKRNSTHRTFRRCKAELAPYVQLMDYSFAHDNCMCFRWSGCGGSNHRDESQNGVWWTRPMWI